MASANAGARSSASRPTSPSTLLSSPRVNARRPRSREPGNRAVEIVEGQLAARQRDARRQADVLRQRVGRLEIEQRREIGAANRQTDAGLGLLRPRLGGALRFGVEAGSRHLRLQPQRRAPHAGRRSFELRRAFARRDRAIEPEQRQQRTALLRRQFRFDADFAAPELVEIDRRGSPRRRALP